MRWWVVPQTNGVHTTEKPALTDMESPTTAEAAHEQAAQPTPVLRNVLNRGD